MANVPVEMDSKKLALLCRKLADDKKAENLVVLDVRKLSSVTDFFVIVTGNNDPHLRAIVDEITTKLHDDHELRPYTIEGGAHAAWMVLDYYDVIVHVMRGDVRQHYDLEGLWNDAPRVTSRAPVKKKAARGSKAHKP